MQIDDQIVIDISDMDKWTAADEVLKLVGVEF